MQPLVCFSEHGELPRKTREPSCLEQCLAACAYYFRAPPVRAEEEWVLHRDITKLDNRIRAATMRLNAAGTSEGRPAGVRPRVVPPRGPHGR